MGVKTIVCRQHYLLQVLASICLIFIVHISLPELETPKTEAPANILQISDVNAETFRHLCGAVAGYFLYVAAPNKTFLSPQSVCSSTCFTSMWWMFSCTPISHCPTTWPYVLRSNTNIKLVIRNHAEFLQG
jgi:hypothetical protein